MEEWIFLLFRNDIRHLNEETQKTQKMLFQSFREFVYRDIYFMLADHILTEDVIQEAFMKAIRKAPQIREEGKIKAWVKKVCRNTTYDVLRKNKKYRHDLDLDHVTVYEWQNSELAAASESVADFIENCERNELLYEAIRELPINHRIVLLLYYFEDMSYEQIAQELHTTKSAVSLRLFRARHSLAERFRRKWGDIP